MSRKNYKMSDHDYGRQLEIVKMLSRGYRQ